MIYVIVRHTVAAPQFDEAGDDICSELLASFGYFEDENEVEAKVEEINREWRKEFVEEELLDSKFDDLPHSDRERIIGLTADKNIEPLIDALIELGIGEDSIDGHDELQDQLDLFGFEPVHKAGEKQ